MNVVLLVHVTNCLISHECRVTGSCYTTFMNYQTVCEDSNRYMHAHLFLIEREYFGFNTLESVVVE